MVLDELTQEMKTRAYAQLRKFLDDKQRDDAYEGYYPKLDAMHEIIELVDYHDPVACKLQYESSTVPSYYLYVLKHWPARHVVYVVDLPSDDTVYIREVLSLGYTSVSKLDPWDEERIWNLIP